MILALAYVFGVYEMLVLCIQSARRVLQRIIGIGLGRVCPLFIVRRDWGVL